MRIDSKRNISAASASHRRLALTIVSMALVIIALAGCGGSTGGKSDNAAASEQAMGAASAGPTAEEEVTVASASEPQRNPYEVAGITDPAAFNRMFEQVQAAVAAGQREEVARLALYPVRVNYSADESVQISDAEQFVTQYDKIITPSVKEALRSQKLDELFVNAKGVMAGAGQMWFGATADTPQQYGIIAVNPNP